jgi:hypothetical protein
VQEKDTKKPSLFKRIFSRKKAPVEVFIEYTSRAADEIKFCKIKQETKKDRVIKIILRVRPQNESEKCDPKHKVRGY